MKENSSPLRFNAWLSPVVPFGRNRILHTALVLYALFWIWMSIHPYSVFNWWLENLLTLVTFLVLAFTYRVFRFNTLSYVLILLFISLHTLGAHYSYNTTPIDTLVNRLLDFERDNFDRIVHFSFGLLIVYPAWEFIERVLKPRRGWSYVLAPTVILAFGAFYELIEMWVAFIVAPEIGTMFLGTQGDVWDSQHDMEVALYGAAAIMAVNAGVNRLIGRR